MPSTLQLLGIVTLLIVGLLGVMGLLVVYIARIVENLKQISGPLEALAKKEASPQQA
jgi:hypothetical protein